MAEATADQPTDNSASRAEQLDARDERLEIEYNKTPTGTIIKHGRLTVLEALEASPEGDAKVWRRFGRLAIWHFRTWDRSGRLRDIDFAIMFAEKSLEGMPKGETYERWFMTTKLAHYLILRFDEYKDADDLDRGIQLEYEAAHSTPAGGDNHLENLTWLASYLNMRFERFHNIQDLDAAITELERAEQLTPTGHTLRFEVLDTLATRYWKRYHKTQVKADSDRAIELQEEALLVKPEDVNLMTRLGGHLQWRFSIKEGKDSDLERAVQLLEIATLTKFQEETKIQDGSHYLGLADSFASLSESRRSLEDLERAISILRQAVSMDFSAASKARVRIRLSDLLCNRSVMAASPQDVDESIQLVTETFDNANTQDPDEARTLLNMARQPGGKLKGHEDYVIYLSSVIRFLNAALQLWPDDEAACVKIMTELKSFYQYRYEQTSTVEDLGKIIHVSSEVLERTADSMKLEDLIEERNSLANSLVNRFQQNGESVLEDLNRAIRELEKVLELKVDNDHLRRYYLSQLARFLKTRFNRSHARPDIDRYIEIWQELEQASEQLTTFDGEFVSHASLFQSLGEGFLKRSEMFFTSGQGKREDDIDRGIEYCEKASKVVEDPYDKATLLVTLADCYKTRFDQADDKDPEDIDLAIKYLREALESPEFTLDERAKKLWLLAAFLFGRCYDVGGTEEQEAEDLKLANDSLEEAMETPGCTTKTMFNCLLVSARIHFVSNLFEDAFDLFEQAVDLVPDIVMRSASYADQQHNLKNLGAISSEFISGGLYEGVDLEQAIRLLELSRGVVTSFSLSARADATRLDPERAAAFTEAISKWENMRSRVLSAENEGAEMTRWIADSQDCYEAEVAVRDIIKEVKEDPEMSNFLGPPSIEEVREVLGNDTIVMFNLSDMGCHAFLINNDFEDVEVLELEDLTIEEVNKWVERLIISRPRVDLTMLQWLWTKISQPILDKLDFGEASPEDPLPRVFWVPTGPMCHLPIHAAGLHGAKSMTVMDRVVSSYSSSLKAFYLGRKQQQAASAYSGRKALLVGVGESTCRPGLSPLPAVAKEIEQLGKICTSLNLDSSSLREPGRQEVMDHLSGCAIFHFAGHGLNDPLEPSHSGIVTSDGLLTVADLMDAKLHSESPFLAFLSACLSGANDVLELQDEGIHLISACQLLGFRHVVGTQWQVADNTCVEVSEALYTELAREGMTDESVCRGLHKALLRLRDQWVRTGSTFVRGVSEEVVGWSDTEEEEVTDEESDVGTDEGSSDTGTNEEGGIQRESRNAMLRVRRKPAEKWVRADWIPYIHYGP
ncbi:hypothetical protein ACJ41O_001123 [Fusarium nematophilum]